MEKMKTAPIFITATGTGVGKTLLAALLAARLRQDGVRVTALKPVSSGDREDARQLAVALGGSLSLDEINPWHFRDAVAPVLAARRECQRLTGVQIISHIRNLQKRCDQLLIEGAGGLLSPLGERVDSRDLIMALRARPVIVALNQLGMVNLLRLTLGALSPAIRKQAVVVLMSPEKPDASTRSNEALLAEYFDWDRIIPFPRLGNPGALEMTLKIRPVRQALSRIIELA